MLEKDFQKKVVRELKRIPYIKVACIQNEVGSNNVRLGAFWKSMGKLTGFSDLIVFNTKRNEIIFVEMKAYKIGKKGGYIGKGAQSDNQLEFQSMVENMGFKYILVDDPIAEKSLYDYII